MADLYNVGDVVIIADSLEDNMPCGVDTEMEDYCGQMVTISKVIRSEPGESNYGEYYVYGIEEDNGYFNWSSPMIASYADDFNMAISKGVIVTRDGTKFIKVGDTFVSAKGIEIPRSDYEGNKHKTSTDADIVEIYESEKDSNYMFSAGELLWKEE